MAKRLGILLIFWINLLVLSCAMFEYNEHYITTPMDGESVRGIITILVSPPIEMEVDSVRFSINSKEVLEDFTSPYSYEWNTRDYTNGTYTLSVSIIDHFGKTENDSITVYVRNAE